MRLNWEELQSWADDAVERLKLAELIDYGVIRRLRKGLGGSHTVVTYPPLDSLEPLHPEQVLSRVCPVTDLNLYVHVAFCEFLCPFCHYDTEFSKIGSEESLTMKSYFQALLTEVGNWGERLKGSSVSSVYVGGGTPTAASTDRLLAIISAVESSFDNSGRGTFCVETSPQTTVALGGAEKLKALVNAGVNRFSIGIQSFDDQLLRRTRGHSQQEVLRAMDIVSRLLDNVNIDLIQDLPGQTDEHIFEDLIQVERFQPAQVTWYVLRLKSESSWYSRYERSALEFPSTLDSARRSLLIREGMRRLGYAVMPGNRFVREAAYRDRFKDVRAGLESTLLGMGVSSYSHGWGYMFRNAYSHGYVNGISEYVARIGRDGFAIERGRELDETEYAASGFVSGIRRKVELMSAEGRAADYLREAAHLLQELEKFGLVACDRQGSYSLTELGSLFEEELCAQFYSPVVRERLKDTGDRARAGGFPGGAETNSANLQMIH